ncbi:acyl-CoA dehydrogenase [Haloarcula rubripromontorii]|uniref:Acyl-CoA dehydrogenase n=1 Tax=Haloarcula rubripromontorii TaxID=1705562 RepID=A0A847TY29_9EURY|nr:acyl-CoA dehydrogenase [Haloarcula rubripromontorii]NLV05955.1 acyl-CoA dehydrogenase [Haloarcula rubripromontorii]
MNNFKSGSGNLDFGTESEEEDSQESEEVVDESESRRADPTSEQVHSAGKTSSQDPGSTDGPDRNTKQGPSDGAEYPYFVRRNNVGDERDTRLEIHVRDNVAEQEGRFRSVLADELDVSEVSKTDAREFALLAAYEHPEKVAELMEDEGFSAV